MGVPIHAGFNLSPGFKMGRFGVSAIVNQRTNMVVRNKSNPLLDVDYIYDRGFILGYGHPLSGSYSSKNGGEQLSFGISAKYIDREEIRGNFNLLSPSLYDAFSGGDLDTVLDSLGVIESSGWGFDVGLDYIKRKGLSEFSFGISATHRSKHLSEYFLLVSIKIHVFQ